MIALLGALWRRYFGGWLGGSRWHRLVLMPILTIPVALVAGWWVYLVCTGLYICHWISGHQWESPRALLLRYTPLPVLVGLTLLLSTGSIGPLFVLGLVGPLVTLGYWFCINKMDHQRWQLNAFIDGPVAVAELWAGAVSFELLFLSSLLVPYTQL